MIRATGSGGVELRATASADVEQSGSGSVVIHGNPPQHNVDDTGSGNVELVP